MAQTASDLMRRDFVSTHPSESLLEAERIMRLARIRHLPVLDAGNLVGVISHRDVLESAIPSIDARPTQEKLEHLRSVTVETVMSHDPVTVGAAVSLTDAAILMLRHKIGCLPVVDPNGGSHVVGLLTESDLVRAAYVPDYTGASD